MVIAGAMKAREGAPLRRDLEGSAVCLHLPWALTVGKGRRPVAARQ